MIRCKEIDGGFEYHDIPVDLILDIEERDPLIFSIEVKECFFKDKDSFRIKRDSTGCIFAYPENLRGLIPNDWLSRNAVALIVFSSLSIFLGFFNSPTPTSVAIIIIASIVSMFLVPFNKELGYTDFSVIWNKLRNINKILHKGDQK